MLQTAVALIIFNRPEATARVFAEIAKVKPRKLFIIADGPRPDRPGEAERCAVARAISEQVDWDCEVFKNYSDVNLGCGHRPATGISWVFEKVERAIILEDDCFPHPSFFRFCDELLEKYEDEQKIMMIAGTSQFMARTFYSYSFCYSHSNWGWATWRRAWQHFDIKIEEWPALRATDWLDDILKDRVAVKYWTKIFDEAHARAGNVDYWDYQWTFALWSRQGVAIKPSSNLITNIGCGSDATHTLSAQDRRANRPTTAMSFPLIHPSKVIRDEEVDRLAFAAFAAELPAGNLYRQLRRKASSLVPTSLKNHLRRLGL